MSTFIKKHQTPIILGLIALAYYLLLCAKSATWIFTGTDNGDWMAAAVTWMVPQPYGSPLYITLCRVLYYLPGDLALKLTIGLSVIPAAITISFVYLIVKHLTKNTWIGITSSLVVLGSAVFLSQSTILEEYALAIMFMTIAFYAYVKEWRYRTAIFMGLGVAVHIMCLMIAVFWALADRRWRYWFFKPVLTFLAIGGLPYMLIPLLMYLDTPRFLIGEFSFQNLLGYWSTTTRAVAGTISIFEAPRRLGEFGRIFIMSFGLALVPLLHNIYKPLTRTVAILLATTMFTAWYAFSCIDPSTYTFFAFLTPSVAILSGIALAKMSRLHVKVVLVGACALMAVNGIFLNADILTKQNPEATTYFSDLRALPDNSVVVTITGGYSLSLFYVINAGKELTPVIYPYVDNLDEKLGYGMIGYEKYLSEKVGFEWPDTTLAGIQMALDRGMMVYFVPTVDSTISRCFNYDRGPDGKPLYGKPSVIHSLTGIAPRLPSEEVVTTND